MEASLHEKSESEASSDCSDPALKELERKLLKKNKKKDPQSPSSKKRVSETNYD